MEDDMEAPMGSKKRFAAEMIGTFWLVFADAAVL
jgi:glycerol uptake facilitator-like aquaporin